ncbi:hypothetical protein O6P43_007601 [Quillaja saponaria]|uniref:Uncharacterized protein n=1 Tax=Quillaja saponaria TaxID=32244 RepID=A0AAD7QB17_QUISA|nr:hypothetical protein O6P43_007601 [Quillaja saponaria]
MVTAVMHRVMEVSLVRKYAIAMKEKKYTLQQLYKGLFGFMGNECSGKQRRGLCTFFLSPQIHRPKGRDKVS